jgi:hypothetical protein
MREAYPAPLSLHVNEQMAVEPKASRDIEKNKPIQKSMIRTPVLFQEVRVRKNFLKIVAEAVVPNI